MDQPLIEQIRTFVVDAFYAPADLAEDASLLDTGTMDSTGVLELIVFVEQRFGVTVGEREILPDNFDSIRRVASFVERKIRERDAPARPRDGAPAPEARGDLP